MDGVVFASSPNFFEVYDRFESSQESKDAWKNNPNAAIVGKLMAEQKGLRIGDILNTESNSMNSNGTNNWSFEIVGFYTMMKCLKMMVKPSFGLLFLLILITT